MMFYVVAIITLLAGLPQSGGSASNAAVKQSVIRIPVGTPTSFAVSADPSRATSMEAGRAPGPWPGFRQDALHTGRSTEAGPVRPVNEWTFDTAGSTYSSPAIAEDGTLYIGSADSVYAIAPDGRRVWAAAVGGYAISSPAIGEDGTIYIGSRDNRLYALLPQDGGLKWAPFETGDEIWASPTIGPDGTIYIGSFDGHLYALEAATGAAKWTFSAGSKIISSPAVGRDGTVYLATLDENLYAIAPNGAARWSFPVAGNVVSSPAIGPDGTIYVGSLDGNLYAVGANGEERWAAAFPTNDGIVSSPAIGANGTIYVGSLDGSLYAVAPDGSSSWMFSAGEPIISSPAVDVEGVIYFGTFDGQLFAIYPDGDRRWNLDLDAPIWSSPALGAGRRLYIASTDARPFTGQLHAIRSAPFEVTFRTEPVAGAPQVVDVSEPNEFSPTAGQLFYRRGGERTFRAAVPLRAASGGFEGDISSEDVTIRGIEYYVQLSDGRTTATYPADDPRNRPAVQRVRVEQSTPAEIEMPNARYAMVSVPFVPRDAGVESILGDDYGPYDPAQWRVLRWEGGEYREHPAINADFSPGNAFFVTVRDGRPFDVDQGVSVDLSRPYRITLEPGWNQVANPFAFAVSLADIQRDADVVTSVAFWDGNEMCQQPACIDVWQPWQGYFVLNTSDEPTSVHIAPVEAPASDDPSDGEQRVIATDGPLVRLVARVPGTIWTDSQNWIGFTVDAPEGARSDVEEAPPFGERVRLSIRDGDVRYARQFQPLSAEGGRWELELTIQDEGAREVELTLIEERKLPHGFQISILDKDHGEIVPIIDGRVTVSSDRKGGSRRLSVLIGTDSFLESEIGDVPVRAPGFSLHQNYPNPFRTETVIGYEVPEAGAVIMAIYDITGRRVRTLIDDVREAGYHRVTWDGRSDTGRHLASGTYLYRISTPTSTRSKKMALLR